MSDDDNDVLRSPELPTRLPDYGETDYLLLPDCGAEYYNLEDAALLGALDMWASNGIPEFPIGDYNWNHDADSPVVRKGIEPKRLQLLDVLVRSVESGQLAAEVFGRNLSDSRLIPGRTYVSIDQLSACLEVHGQPHGDYLAELQKDLMDMRQEIAWSRAEERAEFRHAIQHPLGDASTLLAPDEASYLRRELHSTRLHLAQLERDLGGGSHARLERPLATRERTNLLTLIAVVCRSAGIDYSRHAKLASSLIETAAEMGVSLGESTIESHLKRIPEAVESRSRIAK